ncbi:MAG: hypothetical protein R2877_04680 [Bdellovibrionota bacterium]
MSYHGADGEIVDHANGGEVIITISIVGESPGKLEFVALSLFDIAFGVSSGTQRGIAKRPTYNIPHQIASLD